MKNLISTLLGSALCFVVAAQTTFDLSQTIHKNINKHESIFSVDIDGDGDKDLLTASRANKMVLWYENDGQGNFDSYHEIAATEGGATYVIAEDLDLDGDADAIYCDFDGQLIAWAENDGSGIFSAPISIYTGVELPEKKQPYIIIASDVDMDGDDDIVVSINYFVPFPLDWSGELAWFENDGDGNFGDIIPIRNGDNIPNSITSGDIDGDSWDDLIVSYGTGDHIDWHRNNTDGTFGPKINITNSVDLPRAVEVRDMDDDGDLDVIYTSLYDSKLAWKENDGNGIFTFEHLVSLSAESVISIDVEDLDADGDLDIVTVADNSSSNEVAWYENRGPKSSFSLIKVISTQFLSGTKVIADDFDGDNVPDVAVGGNGNINLASFQNDGVGHFGGMNIIAPYITHVTALKSADINGDGFKDLILISSGDNKVGWFENNNGDHFMPLNVITENLGSPNTMDVGDVDGDGDIDILVNATSPRQLGWLANDGSGNFDALQVISGERVHNIRLHDFDSDGALDVVMMYLNVTEFDFYETLAWMENFGAGTFSGRRGIWSNDYLTKFKVDDINNDGHQDVVVLTKSGPSTELYWLVNDGDQGFDLHNIPDESLTDINKIFPVDLNGDDLPDIATSSSDDQYVAWHENLGNDIIDGERIFNNSEAGGVKDLFAADLDNDDDNDIIISNGETVGWFENNGAGFFSSLNTIIEKSATIIEPVDVDNDGDLDVVFANNDAIFWSENLLNNPNTSTEILESFEIKLFPNPMNEYATLTHKNINVMYHDYELYDVSGRLCNIQQKFRGQSLKIERHNLQAGAYFMSVYETESKKYLGSYKIMIK